jgi:hypothetical protein
LPKAAAPANNHEWGSGTSNLLLDPPKNKRKASRFEAKCKWRQKKHNKDGTGTCEKRFNYQLTSKSFLKAGPNTGWMYVWLGLNPL